jgi:hypothetical protein
MLRRDFMATHMVFLNLILTIVLTVAVLFYRYIYPKKHLNLFFLLLIISIIPVVSILRQGSYESGDINYHATFAMSFFQSLKEGNIIPRWASNLNSTYGYPLFVFIYPLPFYLVSIFRLFGFSYIGSVKVFLIFAYILSGIFTYLWAKTELSEKGAFITAIFYIFAPYHLIDLHMRTDVGEVIALTILPLCLFFIKKYSKNKTFLAMFLASIALALLVLSHNAISYISFPFLLIYSIFSWKTNNDFKRVIKAIQPFLLSLCYSAFFWIPALYEIKFTYIDKTAVMYSFPSIISYLYSPWRYGLLFQGPYGELATILGYAQIIIIILSIIFLIKGIIFKKRRLLILSLVVFLLYFLLMQKVASPLYKIIPLLKHIQFPYRILSIISLIISLIAGIFIDNLVLKYTNKIVIIIFLAVTLPTILNWGARKLIPEYNDNFLIKKLTEGPNYGEGFPHAIPKWVDYNNPWQIKIPENHLEIIQGKGDVNETLRTSTAHRYLVNAETDLQLKENTYYFPGWIVMVDNVKQQINYENKQYPGIITFNLKKGIHYINVVFQDTLDRQMAFILSAGSFLLTIFYYEKLMLSLKKK